MTEEQTKVDALLVASACRLMRAAGAASVLRVSILCNRWEDAIQASADLAEHAEVADAALKEVARIIGIHNAARMAVEKLQTLQPGGILQ